MALEIQKHVGSLSLPLVRASCDKRHPGGRNMCNGVHIPRYEVRATWGWGGHAYPVQNNQSPTSTTLIPSEGVILNDLIFIHDVPPLEGLTTF